MNIGIATLNIDTWMMSDTASSAAEMQELKAYWNGLWWVIPVTENRKKEQHAEYKEGKYNTYRTIKVPTQDVKKYGTTGYYPPHLVEDQLA